MLLVVRFAADGSGLGLDLGLAGHDLGEYIGLAQDQILVDAELDLGAAVLREDHFVADGDVERNELAVLVVAGTNSEDLRALRLLLCRTGQDDAADPGLLPL